MRLLITETVLSNRTVNALRRNGLFTVEEVINYHKAHNIATVKGIGKETIEEITNVLLAPAGFKIKPKKPESQKKSKPRKKSLGRSMAQYIRFKKYFDELYGQGLEVANWHQNGALEPFDNFYNNAIEFALKKGETK